MAYQRFIPGQIPVDQTQMGRDTWLGRLQRGLRSEADFTRTSNTASFTLNLQYFYPCDATSGNIVATLPAAASVYSKKYVVKKIDSSANTITVTASGSDTIDGAGTKVLSKQWDTCTIASDGVSNWYIISAGAAGGGGSSSPLTTKGDIWGYSTVDARIPVGIDGALLGADSSQPLGVKWKTTSTLTAGSLILLGSQVASGATSIDLTSLITSAYDQYVITGMDILSNTGAVTVNCLVSTDNGSTWLGGTNYVYAGWTATSGGTGSGFGSTGAAQWALFGGLDNTASHVLNCELKLYNANSGNFKGLSGVVTGWVSATAWDLVHTDCAVKTTSAINAVRLITSSGTISGTIRVYGVSKTIQQVMINPAQAITATGAFSYTTPVSCTLIKVILQGGGGDTPASTASNGVSAAGNGEYLCFFIPVVANTTYSGVVGAHATASSITINGTTYTAAAGAAGALTAAGGNGGGRLGATGGASGSPGATGVAGTALTIGEMVNYGGNSGGGAAGAANQIGGPGVAFAQYTGGTSAACSVGTRGGGSSSANFFGPGVNGAGGAGAANPGASPATTSYGVGASGASATNTLTAAGANGAQGYVEIIPY